VNRQANPRQQATLGIPFLPKPKKPWKHREGSLTPHRCHYGGTTIKRAVLIIRESDFDTPNGLSSQENQWPFRQMGRQTCIKATVGFSLSEWRKTIL
jgi:hypothetical protein